MLQLLMLTILQVSSENIFQNVLYNAQISDYLDYVDSWSPLLLQNNVFLSSSLSGSIKCPLPTLN